MPFLIYSSQGLLMTVIIIPNDFSNIYQLKGLHKKEPIQIRIICGGGQDFIKELIITVWVGYRGNSKDTAWNWAKSGKIVPTHSVKGAGQGEVVE